MAGLTFKFKFTIWLESVDTKRQNAATLPRPIVCGSIITMGLSCAGKRGVLCDIRHSPSLVMLVKNCMVDIVIKMKKKNKKLKCMAYSNRNTK